MKNNSLSLVLTRISLLITLFYIVFLLILFEPSNTDKLWISLLTPHLSALALATVLNIILSFKQFIETKLLVLAIFFYILAGFLGLIFIFITLPGVISQVVLLIIACVHLKYNESQ